MPLMKIFYEDLTAVALETKDYCINGTVKENPVQS